MDDDKIIDLLFERSEQAIVELSKKYGTVLLKTAGNILNNKQDAEECVNDAYLVVWNSVPPKRPKKLLVYTCGIVQKLALKKYRTKSAQKRNGTFDLALEELEEFIPSNALVEDEALENELSKAVNEFLEKIKTADRIAFVKRYRLGESLTDIAGELHTTEHSISVRLYRIRKELKKFLIKEGFLNEK
jgi:RNA polymerase sigma-70 factor (ECF subfamily)